MTRAEIEAAAQAETPTGKAIVQFFLERNNAPSDYFGLMHLAGDGALSGAITRLLDDGLLERVPNERKTMMLVRMKDYQA